ncbi:hypothetical protein WJX81_008700 [Elliptochloris bilobata]|uniref:General transcription factor TFIIB n=1 Tax=Elliptochloris bilobata TaxID=381761 RepID=A0AAW1RTQ8_9CHLO
MADSGLRAKYEQTCPDCGGTDFVEDHAQGDLICTSCGLVVEAHGIDERSEWRTFGDKDKETVDPTRVGGPSNHLLTDGGLSLVIGDATKGTGNAALTQAIRRAQERGGNPDRGLLVAFGHIGRLCTALGLVKAIQDRACEVFKQISESKSIRGRGLAAVCAAVVYIACRQESNPRTFKEICAVVSNASKKDIGRCYKFITKELEQDMGTIHAADYMRRFGSRLGLANKDMQAAEEAAHIACPRDGRPMGGQLKPWDGKSPLSIAAALLYLITSLPRATQHPTALAVADASGVAEVTVRGTYRDLYPEAAGLVPSWFATPAEVASLPLPFATYGQLQPGYGQPQPLAAPGPLLKQEPQWEPKQEAKQEFKRE